jgi:transposase InsO family protein
MKTDLVADALRMAWFGRRPGPGLIFHSDTVAASIAAMSFRRC